MKKRILSMLLVIVMVLSLVPVSALAEGEVKITGTNYMAKGAKVTLTLTGAAATDTIGWKSNAEKYATVAYAATNPTECEVTGVDEGKTEIVATVNGVEKSFPVAVYQPASYAPKVSTTNTTVDLSGGDVTLEYTVSAGTETQKVVRWSSTNKDVATITYQGVLTPHKKGTTDIKVFYNGLWSDPVTFNVVEKLSGLTITPSKDSPLYPNRTLELTASVDGVAVDGVEWESETPEIVSVDKDTGEVTAHKAGGPVTITARKSGYNDATYQITVEKNEFWITDASGKKLEEVEKLKAGQTLNLQVWDKSNTAQSGFTFEVLGATGALTVTPSGELTGHGKTMTPIVVQATKGGAKFTQKFSVDLNAMTIKDQDQHEVTGEITLYEGDSLTLTAFDGTKTLSGTWTSNSDKVTAKDGLVTGKEATADDETVDVVVEVPGYEKVTLKVKVLEKKFLTSVTLKDTTETPVVVRVGKPVDLESILDFAPEKVTHKNIEWTSDNSCLTIENVDGKDMLVANTFGETTVTGTYGVAPDEKEITFAVRTLAANGIEVDPTMPLELICGESMDLKATLKDAEGKTLETPVQWRLKNDKVIKNLVDLTGNKLTAYPQSTYDFDVELEAFVEGNDKVEPVPVKIHVLPRTTNIALMKDTEDVSDKTTILNVNDAAGIRIDTVIKPTDARKIVSWQVKDPNGVCQYTPYETYVEIKPVSAQKTGAITVIATATDGTSASRETRIEFAKMADNVVITNAPSTMRGGANLQLRTNLDEDKTLTERRVEWSIVGGDNQYASVTKDGFLDTAAVTKATPIQVKATLIANPEKFDLADITLYPAVKTISIMQKVVDSEGNPVLDSEGKPVLVKLKNVIHFTTDKIYLGMEVKPTDAYVEGGFEWNSSNKAVAEVDSNGVLTMKDAGRVHITCTAKDGSNTVGTVDLEIVKAAGFVGIKGADELISGKNTTLKATVYTDDGETLAGNQKVTWSVEDVYGNPTKSATINSRGRLYAKTVNYGTEVVVYATSVEDKEVIGEFHVMIQPKKERTFAAFLEDDDGIEGDGRIIEAPLYMNPNETAVISGQWYIRDLGFDSAEDCSFYSSNRSVATIDPYDGTLETYKKGSTTITVRATDPDTRNVYTAKFTLYVVNAVDHIVISKPNNTPDYVRSGSYMYLSATVWSNVIETIKADNQGVTWGVYEEDGDDLVATKAAYMTANGALVAYSVTENKPVVVVATSKENPSITAEFPMEIRPAKAYTVTALCEDEDSGDMVVPTGPVNLEMQDGTVAICDGSPTAEIVVEVYASDRSPAGCLTAPEIIWETSDKNIAQVKDDGNLYYTGKTGKVKVTPTCKADDGKTYRGNTVTLNISKLVDEDGIVVTKKYANQELYSGKSLLMYADVDPEATIRRVTWSLIGDGDSAVASINPTTGLIRAKKGLTKQETITVQAMATDGSGETGELNVTIYPLATRVAITSTFKTITVGDDGKQMTAKVFPFAEKDGVQIGANQDVKWSSSRSSVLAVDEDGNLTAKRRGTATIKAAATDGSGKYATIRITVVNP